MFKTTSLNKEKRLFVMFARRHFHHDAIRVISWSDKSE